MSASVTRSVTPERDLSQAVTGRVSPSILADTAGKAWLEVHQPGSITRGWDSGDVDWALEQAHRLLRRIGGRVGPKEDAGYWPATIAEVGDYASQTQQRRLEAGEVSIMEAALAWVWNYLAGRNGEHQTTRFNERQAMARWCFCKETGTPYARLIRELGLKKPTVDLHRRRGSLFIAAGLCADEVVIPREVLLARFERARSDMAEAPEDELAAAAREARDYEPPDTVPVQPREWVAGWPIADFWTDLAQFSEPDTILTLIVDRVRAECAGADLATLDMRLLGKRHRQLVSEATRRGLLPAAAQRSHTLSSDELSARIRQLKDAQA